MSLYVDIEKNFRDFSLRVKLTDASSSMGILGASGSGKSMTLRCIAGIETPDKGKIIINGKTVFDSEKGINEKPQKRKAGYLFQNYALFPTMTVEKNIGCGFRGKKGERDRKVAEYIRRYHLEGLEKRYPHQLSGGQQQRAALARMMIGEPDVILLDEPFSALDSYLKDVLQRDMKEFLKDYKGDMVLVTHSREEAFQFCRELTLLKDGRILVSGETKSIFDEPGSVEAARLTGCKNITEIQRLDSHHIYAKDWKMTLRTEKEVLPCHTHAAVRGHWLVEEKCISSYINREENIFSVETVEEAETPFEEQYLIRRQGGTEVSPIWLMRAKKGTDSHEKSVPCRVYFPPEKIMLLQ